MQIENISFFLAFIAGLLSILSPCVLPLLPSYVSYITGISFEDLTESNVSKDVFRKTLFHSLLFICGFSFIFIFLGASASFLGKTLGQYQDMIARIGGGIIILFGLHLIGIIKFSFLQGEKKADLKEKPAGIFGSILVGVVFAAAWTPCVGPILGSILTLAAAKGNVASGVYLLTAYSLGFAIPFLLFSLFLNSFLFHFQKFRKHLRLVSILSGILLLILGVSLITGYFSDLASYLSQFNLVNF